MRKDFFEELYRHMKKNKDVWFICGDLGYGWADKVREDFKDRFINAGAAEQAMMNIACGLAIEGKIPFVYSITTFLLYHPFEVIRNYVNHENLNVKLIGSGRDHDYTHEGFSHWSDDAKQTLDLFPNIKQYWPEDKIYIPKIIDEMIDNNTPAFVSLRR